jgi:hypothetical protein
MDITTHPLGPNEALQKLLLWLDGFKDSGLYKDYQAAHGFTDEEFAEVWATLEANAKEGEPLYLIEKRDLKHHFLDAVCPDCQKGACSKYGTEHGSGPWDALTPTEKEQLLTQTLDCLSNNKLGNLISDLLSEAAWQWATMHPGNRKLG